jgi:hypothetical protein
MPWPLIVLWAIVGGGVVGLPLRLYRHDHVEKSWVALVILLVIVAGVLGFLIGRRTASVPIGSLRITSPASVIHCASSSPQCQFSVTGRVTPEPASDLELLVLVYPTSPSGPGWYIQGPPAAIQANGMWSQAPADIGSAAAPADNGDTLKIEVVLVRVGATYGGSTLSDMAKSETPIADVAQITGLVGQSQIVGLTVVGP